MSYTLEVTKELFLVTESYSNGTELHVLMSKKEVQENLKGHFAGNIKEIQKIDLHCSEKLSKKYFLPKNWERINKKSSNYAKWKKIAESED